MNGKARPFIAAKASAIGNRPCNQDRCCFFDGGDTLLLGLADGLGGHPRGEVAAQLFIDVCEALFRKADKPLPDPQAFMLQCVGKAHQAIRRFGERQTPSIAPRTTAVLAIVQSGIAYWVHVGDSRLYLFRDGTTQLQTRDHAQVQFIRQSAHETPRARSSLTRCLGGLPQPPTTTYGSPVPLQPFDSVLLCSDGLWNQVSSKTLAAAFAPHDEPLETRLPKLVGQAAEAPNSDNVTAVALTWLAPAANPGAGSIPANPNADADVRPDDPAARPRGAQDKPNATDP